MSGRRQPRGQCGYCERDFSVWGMIRHLSACSRRKVAVAEADRKRGRNMKLYHLRAQDEWNKGFWLDLEVEGSTTLDDLDYYLRHIWLECCGHMSMFSIGGWAGDKIPKTQKVADAFGPGIEITHIYDFGDSSHTLIRYVADRDGKLPKPPRPIALMSRNHEPEFGCISCDECASWLCVECMYENNVAGTLCEQHVNQHPHENYGDPLRLANSPRMGLCAYDGPAEPPY